MDEASRCYHNLRIIASCRNDERFTKGLTKNDFYDIGNPGEDSGDYISSFLSQAGRRMTDEQWMQLNNRLSGYSGSIHSLTAVWIYQRTTFRRQPVQSTATYTLIINTFYSIKDNDITPGAHTFIS